MISVLYKALLIRGWPYKDKGKNWYNILYEGANSIYLYILLCLTDF
jgi:hypothetical protein